MMNQFFNIWQPIHLKIYFLIGNTIKDIQMPRHNLNRKEVIFVISFSKSFFKSNFLKQWQQKHAKTNCKYADVHMYGIV